MTRIAVVEDNPDNRLLVDAILADEFEVVQYGEGTSFLTSLQSDRPDLVLLDISLPGMDGVEILSRLRSSSYGKSLPVVALTAHAMSGDRERYLALGFNEYVSKPIVDEEVLLSTIRRLTGEAG